MNCSILRSRLCINMAILQGRVGEGAGGPDRRAREPLEEKAGPQLSLPLSKAVCEKRRGRSEVKERERKKKALGDEGGRRECELPGRQAGPIFSHLPCCGLVGAECLSLRLLPTAATNQGDLEALPYDISYSKSYILYFKNA
jgi:hypothetical protein